MWDLETILEITKNDMFTFWVAVFCLFLFILHVINLFKLGKIRKEYKEFMQKIGNGTSLEEILDKHIEKINKTITKNEELEKFCLNLDAGMKHCIQKIRNI